MDCEEICNIADRLSLSDNQLTATVASVLKAGGADLNDFILSRSTTHRKRILSRYKISQRQMAKFRQNPPKFATLHWDSKMLKDVLGSDPGSSTETLAVLVSGEAPYQEGKLLGIPTIENSSGLSQAKASLDLLIAWDMTDNIRALVFDTTSSNSGIQRGASKLLEDMLNRKVFYLACRHHILEIIVGAVWEKLFGKVKSPENPLFKEFANAWLKIEKKTPRTLKIEISWLQELKKNAQVILQGYLNSEKPPRADYREMAELSLIILGKVPPRGIHWSRPGAIHQARWMARNIYSLKMFMFSRQMDYDEETQEKLERINIFLSLFYTTRWLTAGNAADAPLNDLSMIQDVIKYKQIDPEVATVVLNKLERHQWYLTQEIVPFTLFSSNEMVTSSLKQQLATKLYTTEKPQSFRMGKPLFPKIITERTNLIDLIGPDSTFLFKALNINMEWLQKPVDTWQLYEDFRKAQNFVKSLKVVNDCAERGVKMMADFAQKITTDPKQREFLLQAVEFNRVKLDSFKKEALNK